MKRSALALALAVFVVTALPGCFSVQHTLPPNTYFGQMPKHAGEQAVSFERSQRKNWALAGLLPYTRWNTQGLLLPSEPVKRIENLSIETVFTRFDTLIWVFPGAFYGYYFWAPRTIRVSGTEIRSEP